MVGSPILFRLIHDSGNVLSIDWFNLIDRGVRVVEILSWSLRQAVSNFVVMIRVIEI